mgnify:CR=1 FL=1
MLIMESILGIVDNREYKEIKASREYKRIHQLEYRKSDRYKKWWIEYYKNNEEKRKTHCRDYMRTIRQGLLSLLGGKCCKCGCEDWRVLQIDHINRKEIKERKNSNSYYQLGKEIRKSIEKGESKFQILCANCHSIKTWENGERLR